MAKEVHFIRNKATGILIVHPDYPNLRREFMDWPSAKKAFVEEIGNRKISLCTNLEKNEIDELCEALRIKEVDHSEH